MSTESQIPKSQILESLNLIDLDLNSANYFQRDEKSKLKKCNSISETFYNRIHKWKKEKSFNIRISNNLFCTNTNDILLSSNILNCKTCLKYFNACSNKFCSLQCYKMSKKDCDGNFNIRCEMCDKTFKTQCIFTDYCSNECFRADTNINLSP